MHAPQHLIETFQIHEHKVLDRPLGRHVRHDPRSFAFPATVASALKSVMHARNVPVFDQGSVGSCTGNAVAGCLSTAPWTQRLAESDALDIYKRATHLDGILGIFPPTDTGSSGLAVMKVCKERGYIKGYSHAFGLQHALEALVLSPGIVGISWRTGCDTPDEHGVVKYAGPVRGGHEVEILGLDMNASLVWFANSWGPRWGKGGLFAMTISDFGKALSDHGDVTFPN